MLQVGWPTFSHAGFYTGPLTRLRGHAHAALIGTDPTIGTFRTKPSAAYPAGLSKALATVITEGHVENDTPTAGAGTGTGKTSRGKMAKSKKSRESVWD